MQKTFKETKIEDGIEYNECEAPPPPTLIRATEKQWADELIFRGKFLLRPLDYYKQIEDRTGQGDPDEGNGSYYCDGHLCETSSCFIQYIFCMSSTSVAHSRLYSIDDKYDTIVEIKILDFIKRTRTFLTFIDSKFWVQWGKVQYDKGIDVDKKTLNDQIFNFNAFQKHADYSWQQEYRIVVYRGTPHQYHCDYLEITLGDCSDIISIVD